MLRVSPDGTMVWVQTGHANTNVVLDVDTMQTLATTPAGKQPVGAAFQPNNGRYGLVTHFDDTFVLVLDRQTGREVSRIDVGAAQANASFTDDGAIAFVTVTGADRLVAIDMDQMVVVDTLSVGRDPMGLALLQVSGAGGARPRTVGDIDTTTARHRAESGRDWLAPATPGLPAHPACPQRVA
jgi:YVTN family beta-propeller protein